jgi:hypothetical protein
MPISAQNTPSLLGTSTDVVWMYLLTITANGSPPLYLVNNNEPVTSRGIEYLPYPFALVLPQDFGDQLPQVQISIDNISLEIVEFIRSELTPPGIKVELVTSAYPDIVEKSLDFLQLRDVTYDAMAITGTLEVVNVLNTRFPAETYDPTRYPALFI